MRTTDAPPTQPATDAPWGLWLVRDLASVLAEEAAERVDGNQRDARLRLVDRAVQSWQRTSIPDGAWEAAQQLLDMGDLAGLTVGGEEPAAERSDAGEYRDLFVDGVMRPLYRLIDVLTRREYNRYSESEGRALTKAERRELELLAGQVHDGVQRWAKETAA